MGQTSDIQLFVDWIKQLFFFIRSTQSEKGGRQSTLPTVMICATQSFGSLIYKRTGIYFSYMGILMRDLTVLA